MALTTPGAPPAVVACELLESIGVRCEAGVEALVGLDGTAPPKVTPALLDALRRIDRELLALLRAEEAEGPAGGGGREVSGVPPG
jgi:hypothetical protein